MKRIIFLTFVALAFSGCVWKQSETSIQNDLRADHLESACTIPLPASDEKVVVIGALEGRAVSSVSVAGQEEVTTVIPINVERNNDQIYLVTFSYYPVIWQIKGSTSRISQAVVFGPSKFYSERNSTRGANQISAGIEGVSVEKVTFRNGQACGLGEDFARTTEAVSSIKKNLQGMLIHEPDSLYLEHNPISLRLQANSIKSEGLDVIDVSQKNLPSGFDPDIWQTHLNLMPGGVVDFSGSELVSGSSFEQYEILPRWAGLAKLAGDKAIVPLNDIKEEQSFEVTKKVIVTIKKGDKRGFTIAGVGPIRSALDVSNPDISVRLIPAQARGFRLIKSIPYFPAGLESEYSTKFIVERGIPMPRGNLHDSCAIEEGTGKILPEGSSVCN